MQHKLGLGRKKRRATNEARATRLPPITSGPREMPKSEGSRELLKGFNFGFLLKATKRGLLKKNNRALSSPLRTQQTCTQVRRKSPERYFEGHPHGRSAVSSMVSKWEGKERKASLLPRSPCLEGLGGPPNSLCFALSRAAKHKDNGTPKELPGSPPSPILFARGVPRQVTWL